MEKIIEVKPLKEYKLRVKFADNFTATFDIRPFIKGGISESLLDKDFFRSVRIDEFNGISWENGFDFCPNFLRKYLTQATQNAKTSSIKTK